MDVRVGTSPDSWGVWFPDNEQQIPWPRFLDEVVEAGYDAIELGPLGYLPTKAAVLRSELESRGLHLAGGFVFGDLAGVGGWEAFRDEVSRLCDLLGASGADQLVLIPTLYTDLFTGELVAPRELDEEGWERLAETCQEIAAYGRANGLTAVFHPHAESPIEYDYQIDRLMRMTDPDLLGLCLDVGHHAYCGGDAVTAVRTYGSRIRHLHLKSVDPILADLVRRERRPFATAVQDGVFTELSRGVVDFVALRDALAEVGYRGWGIVEQDMFPASFDKPLPIATRNRQYLRSIDYG
jgi:inosose dehydratase